jgi:hypothetical protein
MLGATLLAEGRPINILINDAAGMTPATRHVTEDDAKRIWQISEQLTQRHTAKSTGVSVASRIALREHPLVPDIGNR